MPEIRSVALNLIIKHSDGVFAAVVDKKSLKKKWDHKELWNFVFAQTLIVNIMNEVSPPNPPIIFFDKGRLSASKSIFFGSYLVQKDSFFDVQRA